MVRTFGVATLVNDCAAGARGAEQRHACGGFEVGRIVISVERSGRHPRTGHDEFETYHDARAEAFFEEVLK